MSGLHILSRKIRDLFRQLFRYVEQAEWATEVMKATGKPVAVCLSVSLAGDMTGVLPGECAVRVARAGKKRTVHP